MHETDQNLLRAESQAAKYQLSFRLHILYVKDPRSRALLRDN